MNIWHRFIQLWQYFTLAWIVTLSSVCWPLVTHDLWWTGETTVEEYALTKLPVRCIEARGTFAVDYEMRDPAEPWNRDPYEGYDLACWYGEERFKALWPEYRDTSFNELSAAQYQTLGWAKATDVDRYSLTKLAALIVFGPPMIALAIGYFLRLAYSGLPRSAS